MPKHLTLLFLAAALAPAAHAAPKPADSQPFALVPPSLASAIDSQSHAPLAGQFIQQADAHLADTPHPLPRLHTEGTLPHQGIRDQSIAAERDFDTMLAFACAYRLTGDNRYLDAESRFLTSWSKVYQPSLNPIDETRFDPVIVAFDLTRANLPVATQQQVVALFRTMATGYLDWERPQPRQRHRQLEQPSHQARHPRCLPHRRPRADRSRSKAFREQVKQNIRPDGSVDDFYKRDALHYVTYDLEPLTTASLAAKAHGEDWFHTAATGQPSLEMAIDWLVPFATGAKTHQEFVNSKVAFDAARDKAGEHGYSGTWEPAGSVNLFTLATWQDAHYAPILKQICANTARQPTPWIQLLMNVKTN